MTNPVTIGDCTLLAGLLVANEIANSVANDERHFAKERLGARMVGALIRKRIAEIEDANGKG
jgi:hypothetical protein